jgi:hypothetical protein
MRLTILFLFISSLCFGQLNVAQSGLFYNISQDVSYQNYIDQIVTNGEIPPPLNIQIAQNDFVNDLKAAGLWTRMKTGYFFHAGSRNVALINLKDPSTYQMTVGNSGPIQPVFVQGVGQRSGGGGSGGYYNQPFKSNEYSGIETDLTIIQYMPTIPFAEYPIAVYSNGMRTHATTATSQLSHQPFSAASTGQRAHSSGNIAWTSTTHAGLIMSTYDGTNSVVYKNGTKTSNSTTPVVPNIGANRLIFNTNSATTTGGVTPSVAGYYTRYIAADFLFDRFNDTDESTFRGIWNTYKTAINLDYQIVAEYASHCWFTRNKSAYDAGTNKSWLGQCHSDAYNASGPYSQYIFQINNTTNVITKFKLGTVTEQDDHNEPSILIRASDSKLLAMYSEHTGDFLRWRISTNALDASAWGSENTFDPASPGTAEYTYPSVFEDASGDMFVFYRCTEAGNNKWTYSKSTNGGATFAGITRIVDLTYSAIAQDPNDKDILHFIVSNHPLEGIYPNYIGHFYFDCATETLHKSDGTDITASIPVDFTDVTIIQTNNSPVGCWLEDIIVDSNGYPRVLFNLIPDALTTGLLKDQYYSEWNGSAWSTPYLLHRESTHYMETTLFDATITQEYYAPLGSFDRANPDRIFSSVETAGHFGNVCEIWELSRQSSSSFSRLQRTFNSDKDQWRPFTIESPTNNVFWLNKIYYDDFLDTYFQTLVLRTY